MRTQLVIVAFALAAGTIAQADRHRAVQVRYVGIHPVAKSAGGGFCYIEGPHVHIYPADRLQYRDYHGSKFFVGDPVAYGYAGPKHAYKGHHPIHVEAVVGLPQPDVEFCYIDGPHFHAFAAPEGPEFKVVDDTYFYVGTPPPIYVQARPRYIGINAIYTPLEYDRPVVTVDAPVGWIGAGVVVGAPGVVVHGPHAHVVAPGISAGVSVQVPMPSIHVGVGVGVGGGVIVHDRRRVKYKKVKRHRGRRHF